MTAGAALLKDETAADSGALGGIACGGRVQAGCGGLDCGCLAIELDGGLGCELGCGLAGWWVCELGRRLGCELDGGLTDPGGEDLLVEWRDGGLPVNEAVLGQRHLAGAGLLEDLGFERLLLFGRVGVPGVEVEVLAAFEDVSFDEPGDGSEVPVEGCARALRVAVGATVVEDEANLWRDRGLTRWRCGARAIEARVSKGMDTGQEEACREGEDCE